MLKLSSRLGLRRTPQGDLLYGAFHAHGSANEVAQKWASRLQQSGADIQAGVQRVTQAPGQAAAAKRQKWVNALADPHTQEKWARNVAGVSLGDWQARMLEIGVPRVAQGAQAAIGKVESIFGPLLQHIDAGVQRVKQMDDSTPAAREQRAIAMMRWNAQFKRPSGI